MEDLFRELKKAFTDLEKAKKQIIELAEAEKSHRLEIEQIKKQLEGVVFAPEWVPTSKAIELLGIKDGDTLRRYATMGLIEFKRGYDQKNYYRRDQLLTLAQKLFDLRDENA